jgi:hypothetical protein
MENNEELQLAWQFVENTGSHLFLTGKAGTGKTTFLKELKRRSPKRMIVLAPTGIAAINAGGVTIHSFFQLPLSPYVPGASYSGDNRIKFQFSKVKRNIIRTLDLVVIDEISMVRADLLDAVDAVLRRYRDREKPFGGAQLLMIGDVQQLAPVAKEDEWELLKQYYDTPYFFSSNALKSTTYQTIELKTVYRQQDNSFLNILNSIRDNKADDDTLRMLNSRYIPNFVPPADSDYIRLTTHNYLAQRINDRELDMLKTPVFTFKAEVEGSFPEFSYPGEELLTLKRGAQIMFIKNDNSGESRYFNGAIGEVVSVGSDGIFVRTKDSLVTFKLEMTEWENTKYTLDSATNEIKEEVEGVFRQYPIRLAWAITIHKSQGLTFEHAIIDASRSFAHGQTYVALSRCKTLEGLVLSAPLGRSAIINDELVDDFTRHIQEHVPNKEILGNLEKSYILYLLHEMYDFLPLQQSFNSLLRTIDEHLFRKYPGLLADYKGFQPKLAGMLEVAAKFEQQYIRLYNLCGNIDDVALQERIHKASQYFAQQLIPCDDLFKSTVVQTDNKIVKKQFAERYQQFGEILTLKKGLLEYESEDETHFSVHDYLHKKAILALQEDESSKNGHRKKTAKEKKPHVDSRKVSFTMFCDGMSLAEIAKERNLTSDTVFSHLATYVESGDITIDRLIPKPHIDMIRSILKSHPDMDSLTAIKSLLPNFISYREIRLVMRMR